MPETKNNARIGCMGKFAIQDIEPVDTQAKKAWEIRKTDGIWRGLIVFDTNTPTNLLSDTIFFSRHYDRENSDMDRMLEEYAIDDESIIGVKFLLVPREKMLFFYSPTPEGGIVVPNLQIKRLDPTNR